MVEKIKRSSWKTSALGAVIILGAIASVLVGKADWTTAGTAITVGAGLLFSKDHDK